jgi:L-aminopeptidase/D-esterase-like protein
MASPLPGIELGHWQDPDGITGCTVLLPKAGAMRAGVHVGGGSPGTRETDLLEPTRSVQEIHGLLLTGGSAFGLDAASGVMRYLREQGLGFDVGVARVPIVPAAVIFDLPIGSPAAFPDHAAGYAACQAATDDEARQGTIGAGYGAVIGKILGPSGAVKSGLGLAGSVETDAVRVGALAVVNAGGDVLGRDGSIIAGTRQGGGFLDSSAFLRTGRTMERVMPRALTNTTLVAVATSARMDKVALTFLARQAHDGLARALSPAHTGFDGDTAFALSTGGDEVDANVVAAIAVDLVAEAIRNAVRAATGVGGVPAIAELKQGSLP